MDKNETLFALKQIVRRNSDFYIRAMRKPDGTGIVPSWSSFATFLFVGFKSNKKESIELEGLIGNGHNDEANLNGKFPKYVGVYRPMNGHWSLWNTAVIRSAILGMPNDAKIKLQVNLDSGTTSVLVPFGIHSDSLTLVGENNEKGYRRKFILDTYIGRHNTARFGFGTEQEK